ncbi:MAG: translation elongation factor Ts [Gemmatimonadota bacterium]|nr:translation elongation factor Ts [Gemmatimonadota bacterium]
MTITSKMIAELRARTSAGILDCKKALEEAAGDMDKASEILRARGIAKAEKRAGRSASQGLVMIDVTTDAATATMVEVNCETDFVARTESFREFVKGLLAHAAGHAPVGSDVTAGIMSQGWQGGATSVEETLKAISAKTGEAMAIKRVAKFTAAGGVVGHYLHHNEQVGVLVEVAGASGEAAVALARELALHVASSDPIAVRAEDIPTDLLARERRIAEEQVAAEGKPEAIRAKIVDGKLKKFVAERSLLEQPFVKDEGKLVKELVAGVSGASVVRFARFKVGEV